MALKKDHKKSGKPGRRPKSEFDTQMLDLARVTRVVKGGRRFRFRATVVIGNRKGKVGVGVAKGGDVSAAMQKATADAKKNMITVSLDGKTIPYETSAKLGSARVILKPNKEGRGVIAGGAIRAVMDLVGIRDVVAKSLGCANKLNVARATVEALKTLKNVGGEAPAEETQSRPTKKKTVAAKPATDTDKPAAKKKTAVKKSPAKKAATKRATSTRKA